MLAKRYRFHGQRSLKGVFKHGDVLRASHLLLRYQSNPRRVHSRLAVVVSKKIARKAHDRNRLRRRVYEAARLYWPRLSSPFDLVFIVTSAQLAEDSAESLQQIVSQVLEKAQTKPRPPLA